MGRGREEKGMGGRSWSGHLLAGSTAGCWRQFKWQRGGQLGKWGGNSAGRNERKKNGVGEGRRGGEGGGRPGQR